MKLAFFIITLILLSCKNDPHFIITLDNSGGVINQYDYEIPFLDSNSIYSQLLDHEIKNRLLLNPSDSTIKFLDSLIKNQPVNPSLKTKFTDMTIAPLIDSLSSIKQDINFNTNQPNFVNNPIFVLFDSKTKFKFVNSVIKIIPLLFKESLFFIENDTIAYRSPSCMMEAPSFINWKQVRYSFHIEYKHNIRHSCVTRIDTNSIAETKCESSKLALTPETSETILFNTFKRINRDKTTLSNNLTKDIVDIPSYLDKVFKRINDDQPKEIKQLETVNDSIWKAFPNQGYKPEVNGLFLNQQTTEYCFNGDLPLDSVYKLIKYEKSINQSFNLILEDLDADVGPHRSSSLCSF